MKMQELKGLSVAELKAKLEESRLNLMTLRFQHATAQLENTQKLPQQRKEIARIMTALKMKSVEAGNE